MGVTHTNIYYLQANQFLAQTSDPTDRENAEYETGAYISGTTNTLADGDCYFNKSTSTLGIIVGGNWQRISFV